LTLGANAPICSLFDFACLAVTGFKPFLKTSLNPNTRPGIPPGI
jgi:hypothetical protein